MACIKEEDVRNHNKGEKMEEMCIPNYILERGSISDDGESVSTPESPILVFVNSKSGGQLGGAILKSFRDLLNPKQVYDLADEKPEDVLHQVLGHLEKLKNDGDKVAIHVRTHLRIIVAGGDGTAGWLLGIMGDLKLEHPPPIATMPLGTGNNLPFSFGWGKKNPGTDVNSVRKFMKEVLIATPLRVDSWHVTMKMVVEEKHGDSLEPVKVPHSLHSFKRDEKDKEKGRITFRGGFWNYFSIGMDAQVAYAFHSERENHPDKFKNQLTNQLQYAKITCTQGWFCAGCTHPASKNIPKLATIQVAKHGEEYTELKLANRGLTPPVVDDGLLEVVGFKDAWHGTVLLAKGHGVRLSQAHKVKIVFNSGAAKETYMRMDGEPWLQPLPDVKKPTVLEITQLGQSLVLATKRSLAESDSNAPPIVPGQEVGAKEKTELNRKEEDRMATGRRSSSSSSSSDDDEPKRKFGAAMTFNPRIDVV